MAEALFLRIQLQLIKRSVNRKLGKPHTHTHTHTYIYSYSARAVMVIVIGNGHGDTSSNPGQD